jgi:hypothetical protein
MKIFKFLTFDIQCIYFHIYWYEWWFYFDLFKLKNVKLLLCTVRLMLRLPSPSKNFNISKIFPLNFEYLFSIKITFLKGIFAKLSPFYFFILIIFSKIITDIHFKLETLIVYQDKTNSLSKLCPLSTFPFIILVHCL